MRAVPRSRLTFLLTPARRGVNSLGGATLHQASPSVPQIIENLLGRSSVSQLRGFGLPLRSYHRSAQIHHIHRSCQQIVSLELCRVALQRIPQANQIAMRLVSTETGNETLRETINTIVMKRRKVPCTMIGKLLLQARASKEIDPVDVARSLGSFVKGTTEQCLALFWTLFVNFPKDQLPKVLRPFVNPIVQLGHPIDTQFSYLMKYNQEYLQNTASSAQNVASVSSQQVSSSSSSSSTSSSTSSTTSTSPSSSSPSSTAFSSSTFSSSFTTWPTSFSSSFQQMDPMEKAFYVFEIAKQVGIIPDIKMYESLLSVVVQYNNLNAALAVKDMMSENGVQPSSNTCTLLIELYGKLGQMDKITQLAQEMAWSKVPITTDVYTALMGICAKQFNEEAATQVLEMMASSGAKAGAEVLFPLFEVYAAQKNVDKVFQLLESMKEKKLVEWDADMLTKVIKRFVKKSDLYTGVVLLKKMIQMGLKMDRVPFIVLMQGFAVSGQQEKVTELFKLMKEVGLTPDQATYNLLIHDLANKGQVGPLAAILKEMQSQRLALDSYLYSSLIKAYARAGDMEKANEYFQQVDFSKVKEPMILFASLIHGYAKHGQVNRSLALLKKMKEKGIRPNTGLFNGLIYGYCVNKDINGAFNLLNLIKMEGLEPDAQTFSGLIHAVYKNITNGGAKRAFQLWEIMKQHRDTIPWINYQPKVLTVLARTCYWAGPQRFVQARSGSDKNSIASPSGSGSNAGGGKSKEEIEEWQKRMWKLVDELQAEGLADVAGEAARWMREYEAGGKSNVVKERRTHRQKFRQHASIRQKMYE